MGHLNKIRGRGPYKTERILDYLISKAGTVFTPKEISDILGINLQTTVTVLNRLALEGTIVKKGRGKYYYLPEGISLNRLENNGNNGVLLNDVKIDPKTAVLIYEDIFNMACETMGAPVVEDFIGVHLYDFDERRPYQSIMKLVRAFINVLGRELVHDIVISALNEWGESAEFAELIVGGTDE